MWKGFRSLPLDRALTGVYQHVHLLKKGQLLNTCYLECHLWYGAGREKRINDRSKLVPQAGRCFILLTIITSIPVTYCCVSNHLKTCLRQRFLCPGFCLAGFSWVVLLNSFEITLMAPGGGWAPARTPGRPQVCRPSGQFFLSMGSLQLNSWALFYDDSRHHRADMEAPRLKRVKPRTSTASLLQHCVSQSTSRKQAQFKGRRIWLHLERGYRRVCPWFPTYQNMTKKRITPCLRWLKSCFKSELTADNFNSNWQMRATRKPNDKWKSFYNKILVARMQTFPNW